MIRYIKEIVVVVVLLCAVLMVWQSASTDIAGVSGQTLRPARGGPIHGYVGAVVSASSDRQFNLVAPQGRLINVPDIEVFARNTKTGAATSKVTTNPQGYFRTPSLAPGTYQICVERVGYASSCDSQTIEVASSIRVLDHVVPIQPRPQALTGTVRLADLVTPCFWFRPAFDTNAVLAAKVALVDGSGNVVAGPVNGNSLGQYVLPTPSMAGPVKLRVSCEGSETIDEVRSLQQDVVIRNNPPQISSLELTKGSSGVRRADPGDVLRATVNVTDPDRDTLHYRWTDDSGRTLGLPDAPSVDWRLINGPALNTLHVQVSDGKGGFDVARSSLRAGANAILFAGRVFDRRNNAPIGNAQVSLNNVGVSTNAAGRFEVTVPDAPRFVLNVNKSGFALSSRVYYGRNTGLEVPLDPTQQMTVDAGKVCQIVFQPDDCEKRCKKKGNLTINLSPDMLVDASGNPYNGPVTFEGFQYDISLPNPIPGDQGAVYQGKTVRLATFGAFYLQPRDAAGQPLKMATNRTMRVSMPIDSALMAKAPNQIPFFSYEESAGMWTEHGTLARVGGNYTGEIKHFSSFNADTQFAGGSCVKVILDPSITLPVSLDAYYVEPSSGVFYHNGTQATDPIVGIQRMTPDVNFTLEIRNVATNALIKSVTLNSGPGLDVGLFPDGYVADPNFNVCNGPVTIYNGNIPTAPTYLMPVTGGSIRDNSLNYRAATNANPGGNRETFPQWLSQNGFPGTGEAQAIYFNNGDLKFGRNMHCRVTSTGTTACYVSNYGTVGSDDSATALSDARAAGVPVATVAMEYDPSVTTDEKVQFWAYDGAGAYIQKAALDGQGAKPLPDLCLACHGGFYSGVSGAKVEKAVFLPFDLETFLYDTAGDPQGTNAAAVQEQFRQLNAMVFSTNPDVSTGNSNTPITRLINIWYSGNVNNAGQQFQFALNQAVALGGFSGHEPLYNDVVKPLCRTCHVTRSSADDWTSFNQMNTAPFRNLIRDYACGGGTPALHQTQNFAMPHAEVPFKKFWVDSLASTLGSQLTFPCPNQ